MSQIKIKAKATKLTTHNRYNQIFTMHFVVFSFKNYHIFRPLNQRVYVQ